MRIATFDLKTCAYLTVHFTGDFSLRQKGENRLQLRVSTENAIWEDSVLKSNTQAHTTVCQELMVITNKE
uniref:Uncharacterized protein n=1 Tax=Anguilla anguilla TaxID=7936 RepID=A0A0E9VXD6_ANGAN